MKREGNIRRLSMNSNYEYCFPEQSGELSGIGNFTFFSEPADRSPAAVRPEWCVTVKSDPAGNLSGLPDRKYSLRDTPGTVENLNFTVKGDLPAGAVTVTYEVPRAEYMYGCTATAVGMILGYYDKYGYAGYDVSNLIAGEVDVNSRGSDGNIYNMNEFDSALGRAIASKEYVSYYYGKTPAEELPYTFVGNSAELNTQYFNCIAAWLGTGMYWRGNEDLGTSLYMNVTLGEVLSWNTSMTSVIYGDGIVRSVPIQYQELLYGLNLYVEQCGYSLDVKNTMTATTDNVGGDFTFEDYKAEIDAGNLVLIGIEGHSMVGYGYIESSRQIILDDTYEHDQLMTWGKSYYYSGQYRELQDITVIHLDTAGLEPVGGGGSPESAVMLYSGSNAAAAGPEVSNTVLQNNGGYDRMDISSGGMAENTVVSAGGVLNVFSSGTASGNTVYAGGVMNVSSGGLAAGNTVHAGGILNVFSSGTVSGTGIGSSGIMKIASGGTADGVEVLSGGRLSVSGGTAENVLQSAGGIIDFRVDGSDLDTVIAGENIYGRFTLSRGTAENLAAGKIEVISGGVLSGGKVYGSDGLLYADSFATVSMASAFSGAEIKVGGGAKIISAAVSDGAQMNISAGGGASGVDINSGAAAAVFAGGSLADAVINNGAELILAAGGTVSQVIIASGAVVNAKIDKNTLFSGTRAGKSFSTVNGFFSGLDAEKGIELEFSSGGEISGITASSGGVIILNSGASAENSRVLSGGIMRLGAGAEHAGNLYIEDGAQFTAEAGSELIFNLETRSGESDAIINNLALAAGEAELVITVKNTQSSGTYILAGNAGDFSGSITVRNSGGVEYGQLSLDNALSYGGRGYSLRLDSGTLSMLLEGKVSIPYDLTNDGTADIFMAHDAGFTGAWVTGENNNKEWLNLSTMGSGWKMFASGNTGANATADVYVYNFSTNTVGCYVTGEDGKVSGWETIQKFDYRTNVLGLGDFNADGISDIVLRNDNGAVGCHLTDGTGWVYFQSLGSEWTVSAVGDFNGDGIDDLALRHAAGFAGSWLVDKDGKVSWHNLDTLTADRNIVGTGDFNGDGTDDILLQIGDYLGVWEVENGSVSGWMGLGNIASGLSIEQIGDFNADGIDDLRVRTASGDLGALIVEGEDKLRWVYYGSVGKEWTTSLAAGV